MKGYRKYFGKKILWFVITFIVAVILNFFLPRMMPVDPVSAITGKLASGMTDASGIRHESSPARAVLPLRQERPEGRLRHLLQPVSPPCFRYHRQRRYVDRVSAAARHPHRLDPG